jgi:hypothetical protein
MKHLATMGVFVETGMEPRSSGSAPVVAASSATVLGLSVCANMKKIPRSIQGRIMKHLATMGVFVETGMDEYGRNGLTTTLAISQAGSALIAGRVHPLLSAVSIPTWRGGCPGNYLMRYPPGSRKTIIEVPPKEQTVHLP